MKDECRDTNDVRPRRKKYREKSCTMKVQNKQRKDSLYVYQYKKTQRYLPHPLETRFHAVKTYRLGYSVNFVIRRYKVSKASLMRWNRRFDGSWESLMDRSHRPVCRNGHSSFWQPTPNHSNRLPM